jgi:hypothetical protein
MAARPRVLMFLLFLIILCLNYLVIGDIVRKDLEEVKTQSFITTMDIGQTNSESNNIIPGKMNSNLIQGDDEPSHIRTATGGIIYSLIVLLTVFAFIGNGAFLVYVFWLSK